MSDVVIKKGKIFGKGVFAKRSFKKGEVVIKYQLKPLTQEEFEKLQKKEKYFTHEHWGVMYLYSSPERYVNHSSNPTTIQDHKKRCNLALKDIKRGEEITTDAAKDDIS